MTIVILHQILLWWWIPPVITMKSMFHPLGCLISALLIMWLLDWLLFITSFPISHISQSHLSTLSRSLTLYQTLCVSILNKILILVFKLYETNHVFAEFLSSFFLLLRTFKTRTPLIQCRRTDGVYYASLPCMPQINVTGSSIILQHHHILGHPSNKELLSLFSKCNFLGDSRSICDFYCPSCNICNEPNFLSVSEVLFCYVGLSFTCNTHKFYAKFKLVKS